MLVVLPWTAYEVLARRAYVELTREVVRERMLESGHLGDVRDRYQALRATYGWTTTGRFDVEAMIAELDARIDASKRDAADSHPALEPSDESNRSR